MSYQPLYPPMSTERITGYPIAPSGYPASVQRKLQLWNDAILAYRLRYEPLYLDPAAPPRSYNEVGGRLAELTGKRRLSKQQIENLCRWVADQIMLEQLDAIPRSTPD